MIANLWYIFLHLTRRKCSYCARGWGTETAFSAKMETCTKSCVYSWVSWKYFELKVEYFSTSAIFHVLPYSFLYFPLAFGHGTISLTNPVTHHCALACWKDAWWVMEEHLPPAPAGASPPHPQLWAIDTLMLEQGTFWGCDWIPDLFLAFSFLSMEVSCLAWLLKQNKIDLSSYSSAKEK